ncbi:MAG: DUF167 domain-containing protein [Patescibacteria group bacterium]|jgi:uncharacterized protein YggU (UPF0235/DUF167 family)
MWENERETLMRQGSIVLRLMATAEKSRTMARGQQKNGVVKIDVREPASKGQANRAIRAYLADVFRVPVENVRLLLGVRSPRKQFKIML